MRSGGSWRWPIVGIAAVGAVLSMFALCGSHDSPPAAVACEELRAEIGSHAPCRTSIELPGYCEHARAAASFTAKESRAQLLVCEFDTVEYATVMAGALAPSVTGIRGKRILVIAQSPRPEEVERIRAHLDRW
jgi:hypothetical protein